MGTVKNVGLDVFPKQSKYLDCRVTVCFNYDLDHVIKGTLVRDDREEPFVGIIALDDGRYIKTSECQYSIDNTVS